MAQRLFPRLIWLLGSVLALSLLIGLIVLSVATRDVTLQHTLRSLQTKVVAADVLLEQPDRAAAERRLRMLGIVHRARAPAGHPLRPFHRQVERDLVAMLPNRSPHIVEQPRLMLWVAARQADDGWIGIPLLSLRGPLRWSVAVIVLIALLLVYAAAAWAARGLVQPLRTLARAAPGLLAGAPAPQLPRRAASEIVDLAAALDHAAADTRAAAQERQLLLAGLSHDMRTPLSRLALALELLDGGDAATREGMRADIAELDAILDQFVAFVRDGRDEPGETLDLGALLDEALAAQQRAGREWQRLGDDEAMLYAKPLALRRAVGNLLENAVRHGAPPFAAELRRHDDGVRLYVRDRGPGVTEDRLISLGKPFYRADSARSGRGSGLGLATVARIAAWHGGTLELGNRPDGGFQACLRLVAARA